MWQLSEGMSWVFCSPLYDLPLLLLSGMCTGTQKMDTSPSSPSLGVILEGYSAVLQVASEEEQKSDKGLDGEELDITLGCHRVYHWCISTLPCW